MNYSAWTLLLVVVALVGTTSSAAKSKVVMDASGSLSYNHVPQSLSSESILAIISNPAAPSPLSPPSKDNVLCLMEDAPPRLLCRGPTLDVSSSEPQCMAIGLCSLTASAIVVDGITHGDLEAGLLNSRHAVTLSALFRARLMLGSGGGKQALIVYASGTSSGAPEKEIKGEIKTLFLAAAAEAKESVGFEDAYDLQIVFSEAQSATEIITSAKEVAESLERPSSSLLREALQEASSKLEGSKVSSDILRPPQSASALVAVGDAFARQTRSARVKFAAWRSRAARGLLVDNFGKEASSLRQRTLATFEAETLFAAGLPVVSTYRSEMRKQLQELVDGSIKEAFQAQVLNLQRQTIKKLRSNLLQHVNNNDIREAEATVDNNAAVLRAATFVFETAMDDLEVPALGLSKDQAVRDMTAKLNDELMAFPDSAAAKLKRAKQVKKVIAKKKSKPSQRAIEFGLDLVAMLRPDGFGSLQGFAGYQLGGNSLTFGVHNDADDPQVISQFGGVRPPLLRVQPKLRVDVEL